ncbi:hypothetical protein D3C73_879190 [compost metagenome]
MGAGNSCHAVAEILNHLFNVERDQRLVLDDHDIGRHLSRDFAGRFVEQLVDFSYADIQHLCSFLRRKAFDGNQQESMTCLGRNVR